MGCAWREFGKNSGEGWAGQTRSVGDRDQEDVANEGSGQQSLEFLRSQEEN